MEDDPKTGLEVLARRFMRISSLSIAVGRADGRPGLDLLPFSVGGWFVHFSVLLQLLSTLCFAAALLTHAFSVRSRHNPPFEFMKNPPQTRSLGATTDRVCLQVRRPFTTRETLRIRVDPVKML
jgi:hypothetical protein